MREKLYKAVLFLCLVGVWGNLKAQEFTASANRSSIGLNDEVQVSFTLNGANGSSFRRPDFANFRILSGPNVSNSISMGGTVSITSAYSFVLQPTKMGKFVIRPASIDVNGKTLFSNSLVINVGKGASGGPNQNSASANSNSNGAQDIFLTASANKTNVVQGEAVAITYRLFVGNNVRMNAPMITGMPNFTGFWVENGKEPKQINATQETYKGKIYQVYVIRKMILFPQKTGQLTVDPLEIECDGQINEPRRRNPFDPFSDMFGDFFNQNAVPFHKDIKSDPLKINVAALPDAGKPASFNGMVGKAALSVSASPDTMKANSAITYSVTIGGEGNLSLLQPIKLKLPSDIDVYEPKTVDKIDRSGDDLTGTRTFEYTLMPHKAGKFEIPSVVFSYFDPTAKKYFETKTDSIAITVEGSTNQPSTAAVKPAPKQPNKSKYDYVKWGVLLASSLILFSAVVLFVKRTTKLPKQADAETEEPYIKTEYTEYLEEARKLALLDENDMFFTSMLNGLYAFICQKYRLPFSELSYISIKTELEKNSVPEDLIVSFLGLVGQCETVKYAPNGTQANKEQVYNEGKALIEKIKGV